MVYYDVSWGLMMSYVMECLKMSYDVSWCPMMSYDVSCFFLFFVFLFFMIINLMH